MGGGSSQGAAKPQAAAAAETVSGTVLLPVTSAGKRLSDAQQELYLHLRTRGASAAAACGQVGVSALDVHATFEQDDVFRERLAQVNTLLSQNVAAALYRSAMEGSVAAQTFFLKNQPPPNWQAGRGDDATENPYQNMTDDELIAFARASGLHWPTEESPGSDPPAVAD